MNRRGARIALVAAALALSGSTLGQTRGHVLHRPIPGDLPVEATAGQRPIAPPEAIEAVEQNASGTGFRPHGEIDSDVMRPRAAWETPVRELDRQTQSPRDARLGYSEVFTPAIAPFKRSQAYDAVDELGRLTVRDPSLRAMFVGQTRGASEPVQRFVGEVLVETAPDRPTPIPGVAGEQRVVSYTTSTRHEVEFERDSAGNLFVRGRVAETTRITYVLEAPESAFVAEPLPRMTVSEAAAEVDARERPHVPTWLQNSAVAVLERVHVQRTDSLAAALDALVAHFRSFRDDALPSNVHGPDMYSDLALGGVGAR